MPISAEDAKCAGCQEATEEELLAQLDDVLKEYADVPGALIPVLQIAQAMFGYLPEAALKKIALALDKPYSEVAGVVGFYSFFTTVPRGKHLVRVCLGTACYVRGGKQVLAALKDLLADRSRRDHFRSAVLARRGPLLRRLRPGAGDHDRRRRPPAGQAGPAGQDPRPVPRTRQRPAGNGNGESEE